MRNLFLVLVLANLALAAWHHWFAAGAAGGASAADRELEGITLVREAGTARRRAEAPRDAAAALALPAPSAAAEAGDGEGGLQARNADEPSQEGCVSVGPFRELAQAAAAASQLRAAGHQPRQRVTEGEFWQGYWVYLEGFATAEEANEVLVELRGHGFNDAYVIRGGDTSSISLGIFSEVSRAGRHREDLRELGYEPTIADRTGSATVYWVDVTLAPEQVLDVEALQTPGRIVRLEQRACEAEE